jgi:hypothetical protein
MASVKFDDLTFFWEKNAEQFHPLNADPGEQAAIARTVLVMARCSPPMGRSSTVRPESRLPQPNRDSNRKADIRLSFLVQRAWMSSVLPPRDRTMRTSLLGREFPWNKHGRNRKAMMRHAGHSADVAVAR